MAKLPNYNLIYLTTYKDIFTYIINDNELKKKCVKSSIDDEIKKLKNTKTLLEEFKEVNIGLFNFVIVCDNKMKDFMNDTMKLFELNKTEYNGIENEQIKNIIDSDELNLMFYSFGKIDIITQKSQFNEQSLLELDSLLTDYSYVNDCKYKIIVKFDYSLI